LSAGQGRRKKDEKELVGQEKGSSVKQKQRPLMEAKENKRFILYFSSSGHAQPLSRKYGFSMCSRKDESHNNECHLLLLFLSA